MIILYRVLINLVLLFSPLIFVIRFFKKKENLDSFKQKILFKERKKISGKLIWFHGASVGELKSVMPLIEKLENNSEIDHILITSNTLSSSKVIKRYKLKKIIHQFFPIDSNFLIKKFVNHWNPSKAIFIDSEIWPNTFLFLKDKKIPIILINGRITKKTFTKWMLIKNFAYKIFSLIDICYPANLETKKILKKLHIKKIKYLGNLKFTQSEQELITTKKIFVNRKIWCASSTHEPEEIISASVHLKARNLIENLLTIIIPRHIERCASIKKKIEQLGLKVSLSGNKKKINGNTEILLVNSYGKTSFFFNNSSLVFLGGSLIKHGGQNPLEAARAGNKILYGPNVQNFREVYKFLEKNKISKKIYNEKNIIINLVKHFKKNKKTDRRYLKLEVLGKKILKNHYNNITLS